MSSVLPPIPPRPDLGPAGPSLDRWHVVDPGRMNAPAIVAAGMRLWAEHWLRWGLASLVFTGIATVAVAALDPWSATYGARFWAQEAVGTPEPSGLAAVIGLVAAVFLGPWLYVMLTKASLEASLARRSGERLIGGTIRGIRSVLWILLLLVVGALVILIPLFFLAAATYDASQDTQQVAVGIAAVMILGLAIWIAPRLIVLLHVFVAEDRRGTTAIAETWRRSRGAWTMALGVLVLNILIAIAIALVPGIVAGSAFPLPIVEDAVPRAILNALVSAIVGPIGVAIGAALYLELSARKGVLDQASMRSRLARFD